MAGASQTVKRVLLELGGKSANIVLDDADFDTVVPGAAMAFMHAGQGCGLPTRLLLPSSRYDEGVEILKDVAVNLPYGDPLDMANTMGPLISSRQRSRVLEFIRKGIEEGARLAIGGGRPTEPV